MNKTGTQKIETQRLILWRFEIEDAEDMYNNWASDPEVTKYLTWPVHSSVEVTRSLLADWITHYADGGYFNWVMEYKETGKAIGNISVVKLNENTEAADMGYCMSRACWGQGLMPEALKAVMTYLFDVVGLNRIAACHDVNNPKSGRVMDKAGMKQEGILRAAGKNNQGICDEVWHAAIREDRDTLAGPASELQDTEYNCGIKKDNKWFRYRAAAIIVEDGCVLFAGNEREDYYYSIGGAVHMGETAEEAVKREVYEETGVEYGIDRLAVIHENFFNENNGSLKGMDCHEVALYFLMKPRGTQRLNSNSYTLGVKENMYWLPIEKLDTYKAFPSFMKTYLQTEHSGVEHIITDESR